MQGGADFASPTVACRCSLFDGKMLGLLMIRHGLGVKPTNTYVIKQVDTDYFAPGEIPAVEDTSTVESSGSDS